MHMTATMKDWMHHVHEESVRVGHKAVQMLHEKSFWAMLAIVALLTTLFSMLLMYGNNNLMQHYSIPMPYFHVY